MTSTGTASSLSYHEPGIVTILIQSSFLLTLNAINFILDRAIYCGLLGQVFLGVAWGTPGAKWLNTEAEQVIVQLGYIGLLLIVYEGGLSTSLRTLKANLFLSVGVALTGIALPIGLSFILAPLMGASQLQCFAAGAALCATSLGTTFTVLGTSGLIKSRLGVVLSSAAMMDDVVGLVMVQVISNLGKSNSAFSAITVVRPVCVSFAFATAAPLVCMFVVKPLTIGLNGWRAKYPRGLANRTFKTRETALAAHAAVFLGCVTGASYAGTSTLFAAYIAGAAISWWDAEVPHYRQPVVAAESQDSSQGSEQRDDVRDNGATSFTGTEIFEHYLLAPLNRILRPFFFASIGFSIPITEMFTGEIVWKGVLYTVLMIFGKICCGAWLVRISFDSIVPVRTKDIVAKFPKPTVDHFWGRNSERQTKATQASAQALQDSAVVPVSGSGATHTQSSSPQDAIPTGGGDMVVRESHSVPAGVNPRSIYPASILGCAMTARGEIGFLISSLAESNGIFASDSDKGTSSDAFLVVTWAIVLCTILGPIAVGLVVGRVRKLQRGVEKEGRVVKGDVLGVWGVS